MGNNDKLINIGGYGESDPKKGVLAYNTPLGKILMKMKAGEKAKFNNFDIEIISIM
jgi:transcription elongation GreA/GreB family factor